MKITQSFRIDRPRDDVWALFEDVPTVAPFMPGAELTGRTDDGAYTGRVNIKLGPFSTAFEGEAVVTSDPDSFSGHVNGKGIDKRGGSRSQLGLDYALTADGDATEVSIDADIRLTGPIAQFGRTGVITEAATVLINQFVDNIEAHLASTARAAASATAEAPPAPASGDGPVAPKPTAPSTQISVFAVLRAILANIFGRLFGRTG